MIFYRLQSNAYKITSEHISFNCNFDTLDEAMRADLLDNGVITEDILNEELKTKTLKNIWSYYKSCNCYFSAWVEPGTCCYRNPDDLYNYFEFYFSEIEDEDNNSNYILIFEGEFIGYGSEGEDCAKFINEIERMAIVEFDKRFNLTNRLSA
ncbi:hypothetical protein AL714_07615 [Clostridium botulinum]|uniref:hypothetical protein n=1 Tax=Clostridium botulinum TaxID=1491 RepID=UPI0004A57696|nr:hypothetical protein [Clostridium botulinum]KEI95000.1 hypothetical protein N496_18695 [Clostridium botulinum A2B3 87]MCC5439697.1 hypothetical protein [Clostridium botulinum]NFR57632.1 hypothetical protein [Clostridium botulinum]OPD37559.1 hypothetical protein AL714_07615 [Clostridium botulinum]